jgi:hypothetical protein
MPWRPGLSRSPAIVDVVVAANEVPGLAHIDSTTVGEYAVGPILCRRIFF